MTVGLPGAPDLAAARESAGLLGMTVALEALSIEETVAARARWSERSAGLPRARSEAILGLALAIARAPVGPVLCGQGVDELFLGYAHFEGLDPQSAEARSRSDLKQLVETDAPIVGRIAADLDRPLVAPFLHDEFTVAALEVPIDRRLPSPRRKELFRRWAVHRGLPSPIADRPKRAIQFGARTERTAPRTGGRPRSPSPP